MKKDTWLSPGDVVNLSEGQLVILVRPAGRKHRLTAEEAGEYVVSEAHDLRDKRGDFWGAHLSRLEDGRYDVDALEVVVAQNIYDVDTKSLQEELPFVDVNLQSVRKMKKATRTLGRKLYFAGWYDPEKVNG